MARTLTTTSTVTAGAGASSGGTTAWVNPGNITSSNNVYATCTAPGASANTAANYAFLQATGFGFSIPANALIVGITVGIERVRNGGTAGAINDNTIQLLIGGVGTGTNKSAGAAWQTVESTTTFGSATDTWGLVTTFGKGITGADINASNFGVQIRCVGSTATTNRVANVDAVTISVTYLVQGQKPRPKPAGRMRLNPANPYAQRLLWATLPGSDPRELRTGAMAVKVGANAKWGVQTPLGPAAQVTARDGSNHGFRYDNSLNYMSPRIGSKFSMMAIGAVDPANSTASNGKLMGFPVSESVWNDPWNDLNFQVSAVPLVSGSAIVSDFANSDTVGSLMSPSSGVTGVMSTGFHSWSTSWDGTNCLSYEDGILIDTIPLSATSTATKPVFKTNVGWLFNAGTAQPTEGIAGYLLGCFVFDGTLTAADHAILARDPWQMFLSDAPSVTVDNFSWGQASAPPPTATFVQARGNQSVNLRVTAQTVDTGGVNNIAFTSPCSAGSLLVAVFCSTASTVGVASITDNASSTWVEAVSARSANATLNEQLQVFYCLSAGSGAQNLSITGTGTGVASMGLFEFSLGGATATLDAVNTATAATGTPTISVTTTAENDVGVALWNTGGGDATGITTGWTRNDLNNINWYDHSAYDASLGAIGVKSITPTGTTSNNWQMSVATFKLAGSGTTTNTVTASLGALLQKQNITATASLGSLLQKQNLTKTASLDAQLAAIQTKTASLGSLLQKSVSKTASLGSLLQKSVTATSSLGSLLQKGVTKTASLDSVLNAGTSTRTVTASLGALLQKSVTKTASLGAVAQKSVAATASTGSLLQKSVSASASLGSLLQKGATATASIGSLLQASSAKTASTGALLKKQDVLVTGTISSLLQKVVTGTVGLDAQAVKTRTATFSADCVLGGTNTRTTGLQALLQGAATRTAGLDARVFFPLKAPPERSVIVP